MFVVVVFVFFRKGDGQLDTCFSCKYERNYNKRTFWDRREAEMYSTMNIQMMDRPRATMGLIHFYHQTFRWTWRPQVCLIKLLTLWEFRMSRMVFDEGDEDISHGVYSQGEEAHIKRSKVFFARGFRSLRQCRCYGNVFCLIF